MVCGVSHYSKGLFHLMNHAALLFLSAGSVAMPIIKYSGVHQNI